MCCCEAGCKTHAQSSVDIYQTSVFKRQNLSAINMNFMDINVFIYFVCSTLFFSWFFKKEVNYVIDCFILIKLRTVFSVTRLFLRACLEEGLGKMDSPCQKVTCWSNWLDWSQWSCTVASCFCINAYIWICFVISPACQVLQVAKNKLSSFCVFWCWTLTPFHEKLKWWYL